MRDAPMSPLYVMVLIVAIFSAMGAVALWIGRRTSIGRSAEGRTSGDVRPRSPVVMRGSLALLVVAIWGGLWLVTRLIPGPARQVPQRPADSNSTAALMILLALGAPAAVFLVVLASGLIRNFANTDRSANRARPGEKGQDPNGAPDRGSG